jgi:response regulator NasT
LLASNGLNKKWLNLKSQMICFLTDEVGYGGLKSVAVLQKKVFYPLIVLTRRTDHAFLSMVEDARALACLICPADEKVLALTIRQANQTAKRMKNLEKKIKGNYKSLQERKIISRAQGVLMNQENADENEALSILMHQAMLTGKSLVVVARNFLNQVEQDLDLPRV